MIKTIIFNFAGVITTSAIFPRVAKVFGEKAEIGKEGFYRRLKSEEKEYLLGKVSTRFFWKRVCKGTGIGYAEFADEISRYEINEEIIRLLKRLRKRYALVLLSDNYAAIYEKMMDDRHLLGIFDHSFFSHQLHMVKMYDEEKVFRFVVKRLKVKEEECVFIDDKIMNLKPAKEIGMNIIHFKDSAQLEKELKKLKVMF